TSGPASRQHKRHRGSVLSDGVHPGPDLGKCHRIGLGLRTGHHLRRRPQSHRPQKAYRKNKLFHISKIHPFWRKKTTFVKTQIIYTLMTTGNVRPATMERITTSALAKKFIEEQINELRAQIGDKKVLLALSGGVDSSVVAALLIKAVGKQLVSVHVNHGLLRKGEPEQVVRVFRDELDANLIYVDATDRFLDKLAGVADPEQKRKIIGAEFIRVFEEEARKLEGISFLAQGTIYPDIIESGPVKSHHNVGGLPEDLQFELVEPIKLLFKDEVRVVGKELGLPDNMVFRQPFPGPGLGVRCTGAITRDRLEALRESDAILREEFAKNGLEGKVWQYFTVVPDYKSTGVKDNKRSWDWPVIIRAVNTRDAMTATIEEIPYPLLHHITQRIVKEVPGVNRVLYDLTPKPTGTIEWE
ncbi:MAG: glutamine-hydrolyzing GMP synthase, partial [Bacteroidales bacterium]|nr:glutamine-hydrolyzing GMP synthase [Bacteroidales bacterium]